MHQESKHVHQHGDAEAMEEGFVFGHVVGGTKVEMEHIFHLVYLWGDEDHAGSQALEHLRPIDVHGPVLEVDRQ